MRQRGVADILIAAVVDGLRGFAAARPTKVNVCGAEMSLRGASCRADDKGHIDPYHGDMKTYRWSEIKNEQLKRSRGISFEDIVLALDAGGLLEIVDHPNARRYPRQKIFVIALAEYVYLVPHIEELEYVFLKTIVPSRKATRDYGEKGKI